MTSFTEDMRRRGHEPGEPDARARRSSPPARGSAASSTSRRRSRSWSRSACGSPTARRWRSRRSTSARRSSPASRRPTSSALVLRAPARALRHRDRRRRPDDRADGDERGGVDRARRAAPLAGVPVRARERDEERRDRGVRAFDLPRRPVPARHRAPRAASVAARHAPSRAPTACGSVVAGTLVKTISRWFSLFRAICTIGLDKIGSMCESPRRGQVVQTNWRPIRRVPRPREGSLRTAGRPPSLWRIVDESTHLRRRRPRRSARGRGLDSVRAAAAAAAPRRASITVWLQIDAQTGWPDLVAAANAAFETGIQASTVDVQYQTWRDHLQKFDATLAGGNAPDVIEMGNTEMTKYMAAGAFADLTPASRTFANSRNWLKGLAASGVYNGKTYGVPYYAGSRVVTYRTDLLQEGRHREAAERASRSSRSAAKKLAAKNRQEELLARLHRRHGLVRGHELRLRLRRRRSRRSRSGKWVGRSTRRRRVAGPDGATRRFFDAASRASKTARRGRGRSRTTCTPRARPPRSSAPRGSAAASARSTRASTSQFVMPSHMKGKSMPGFLGGSDLASRPARRQGARDGLDQGVHEHGARSGPSRRRGTSRTPRTCSATASTSALRKRSWFVPTAKNWVNVENGNILRTMLARILTGKRPIKQATASASDNITSRSTGSSSDAGTAWRAASSPAEQRSPPRQPSGLGGVAALTRRGALRAAAPYLLIAPVARSSSGRSSAIRSTSSSGSRSSSTGSSS